MSQKCQRITKAHILFLLLPMARHYLVCQCFHTLEVSRSRALRHTTLSYIPLDEGSASRRTSTRTTHDTTDRHPCPPDGIRTHDPSNRAAADPHLRPLGHWNRTLDINLRMLTLSQIVASGLGICCELRSRVKNRDSSTLGRIGVSSGYIFNP